MLHCILTQSKSHQEDVLLRKTALPSRVQRLPLRFLAVLYRTQCPRRIRGGSCTRQEKLLVWVYKPRILLLGSIYASECILHILRLNTNSLKHIKRLPRPYHTARNLRMPMTLLDLFHIMHKQQLRRHAGHAARISALLVVKLDR